MNIQLKQVSVFLDLNLEDLDGIPQPPERFRVIFFAEGGSAIDVWLDSHNKWIVALGVIENTYLDEVMEQAKKIILNPLTGKLFNP